MNQKIWSILLFSLLFIFTSCEDSGFLPLPEEEDLVITTLDEGAILLSEGEIPVKVTLLSGGYQDKTMTLELYDGGVLIGENQVEGDALEDVPPLTLPTDLPPGIYRLVLKVYNRETFISEQILTFFLTDEQPHLTGITSFPLVLQPGAQALLSLELPPTEGDPWIRWSLEGQTIQEGRLSELTRRITIEAPETEGIYTVRTELFPFAPPGGEDWNFSSSVYEESLLYVSREMTPGDYDLLQEDSFYSLYHFQGEYADWSGVDEPTELNPLGEPKLDESLGIFGYRLDGFHGFSGERFPFPVSPEGRLEPFSLVMVMALTDIPRSGEFFHGENESGDFLFDLKTDPEGIPLLTVASGEAVHTLKLTEPWNPGIYPSLTITVFPDYVSRELNLLLYQGGELVASSNSSWNREGFTGRGRFRIGGADGAPAVLDELGVFYRDEQGRPSPSPDMFLKDSLAHYGGRLLYADGFDSPYPREGGLLEWQEGVENGDQKPYQLKFSRLGLFPGAQYFFPSLPAVAREYSGTISLGGETGEGVILQLQGEIGEERLVLAEVPLVLSQDFSLTWSPVEGNLSLNGQEFAFPADQLTAVESLRLGVVNRGVQLLFLKDVIILKESLRLSQDGEEPADLGEILIDGNVHEEPLKNDSTV